MRLPNWFRVAWWLLLTGSLTVFLWLRFADLVGGKATAFDIVAFIVWVCLLLAPVFGEIELMGIKLKQEIASVKEHIDGQVQSLRADIRNSVDVRTQFSQNLTLMPPPSDAQLPKLEEWVRETLERQLKFYRLDRQSKDEPTTTVPEDTQLLFQSRLAIERELRRIWSQHFPPDQEGRPVPPLMLILMLVEGQYLTEDLARAIREVYRVCSPALHGQPVTEAQRRFVREVTPDLLRTLRAI